jgi:hypothetical protein
MQKMACGVKGPGKRLLQALNIEYSMLGPSARAEC